MAEVCEIVINGAEGYRADPTRRPAWLAGGVPQCDFVRDGRSMPSTLTDHTTFPGL